MQTHHAKQLRSHLEAIHRLMASHRQVWEAEKARTGDNGAAYSAARRNWLAMMDHWTELYDLLPEWDRLERGDAEAVEGYLTFIEQDVPAFRVGYLKERVYRQLQRLQLSQIQRGRVLRHTLALVSHPDYRREMGALGILASKVCDEAFIAQLAQHFKAPAEPRIQVKAARMLLQIHALRPELRASMLVSRAEAEAVMRAACEHSWARVRTYLAERGLNLN